MKITGNTILITGGATGIGFALAEAFLKSGNQVIICGRREKKLLAAQNRLPGLHIRTCDVCQEHSRRDLLEWALATFKDLNVLINNAGIQRRVDFTKGCADLHQNTEIATNFEAPIFLSALFAPHLMKQPEAAIINVSSALAFVPLASVPIYCATKAALHSFSMSLRRQLRDTSVKVFEVIPPMVRSELHDYQGEGRVSAHGLPASDVAVATLEGMLNDEFEIPVGHAQGLWQAARTDPERFAAMNG